MLWNSLSTETKDDQRLLNEEFNKSHVQWQSAHKNIKTQSIDGRCANGLRVTVVSRAIICRNKCSRSSSARCVWHETSNKTGKSKIAIARAGKVWFLRDDWKKIDSESNSLKGNKLLKALSTLELSLDVIHTELAS